MLRVILYLTPLILLLIALVDCIQAQDGETRQLPKIMWIVLVILVPVAGPLAWFIVGRPVRSRPAVPKPSSSAQRRPLAPDDDPHFLSELSKTNREQEETLRKWEEDLRRREAKLRKENQADQDSDDLDSDKPDQD